MSKRKDYFGETSEWNVEDVASLVSWVTTGILIVFMLGIGFPVFKYVIGDGGMGWLAKFMWLPLLIYFNIQLWGTSTRESTDMGQWFIDNLLALVASFSGLFLLLLPGFRDLGANEKLILMQCTAFSLSDLLWGLLFSQRIAFAGKERGETRM